MALHFGGGWGIELVLLLVEEESDVSGHLSNDFGLAGVAGSVAIFVLQ
jgi:hypothetical protein